MHAHLLFELDSGELDTLASQLDPGITFTYGNVEVLPQGVNTLVSGRPGLRHLETCSTLQSLIIPWAGLPETTRDLLRDYPAISVYNLHNNAPQVAEMALALLLAAGKQIVPHDQQLRQGDWTPRYAPPTAVLLRGKTALILGYGAIGQQVSQYCRAFGMRILAIRRNPDKQITDPAALTSPVQCYPPAALHTLLPEAQVLMVTLPLTEETHSLIGEEELALLPQGAIVVNVGRGPIIEEKALYNALNNGHLGGAGIDVWYNYPAAPEERSQTYPSNFPVYQLPNVVLSPHRAGAIIEREGYRMVAIANLLNDLYQGKAVANQVDIQLGY